MTEFAFPTVRAYTEAYREGRATPLDVARRLLDAVQRSDAATPPLRAFIAVKDEDLLRQAHRSTERYAAGAPLGPWDGVPVAVKDELDQAGYSTTAGTRFLGRSPATEDATVVARLRGAGALLPGKANMHEVGLGATGINPHHGSARNPYDLDRITGGSSSGSAAAVASGLCPAAIGADGGGSLRIPAALCGIAAIKATFGRVSQAGATPLCWSLAHTGPLAASLRDAAELLALISGPDPRDPLTLSQPPLALGDLERPDVAGLRLGWCESWCSKAHEDVLAACQAATAHLVARGAELREVQIEHLDLVPLVGYVTIGVEIGAAQYEHRRDRRHEYGADTRLLLGMADHIPAIDYVRAQRLRTVIAQAFARVFEEVDLLVTPTTACTAPQLRADAARTGEQDDALLEALTAFAFAANLTGYPALSVPVGYDAQGLPIGLQIMARHWDEATALRAGLVVEQALQRREPRVFVAPLR